MITDTTLKQLVQRSILDVAFWLLGEPVQSAETRTVELAARKETVRPDMVFLLTLADGRRVILHIEFQGPRSKAPMPRRMLDYITRLLEEYPGIPLHCVVLYVGKGAGSNDTGSHTVRNAGGHATIHWHYQVIHLWKMAASDLLKLNRPALLPLLGQTRMQDPMGEARQAIDQIRTIATAELRHNMLVDLMMLMSDKEVIAMINDLLTQESELGIKSGYVEFLDTELALRMLNRKLGALNDALTERVKALPPTQIDRLLDDVFNFETQAELERWLTAAEAAPPAAEDDETGEDRW